jgi:dCMP deaminase
MSWDEYFFKMIEVIKMKSKDPVTQVGCVIVDDNNAVLSTGYNGFPIGVNDTPSRYEDRSTKMMYVEHSERNAIFFCARRGIPLEGARMYITWYPCCDCCRAIIQSGIKEIIIDGRNYEMDDKYWSTRWKISIDASKTMLREANVGIKIWRGN